MSQPHNDVSENPQLEKKTANLVAFIIFGAMLFDGYDLVIYGVVLPRLLADPTQIGTLDPAVAGLVGSYALIGVLVGSLFCGAIGDFFGRRRLMITGIAWFSIGMLVTALATSVLAFGVMRFITGIGLGIAIATAGATMAEFAPGGRRQFYNSVVYSGVAAGGVLAALAGILLLDQISWRGLFMIGALPPLLLLVPLAIWKLPESPRWLLSRGNTERAQEVSRRTGVPLLEEQVIQQVGAAPKRSGYAAVLSKQFAMASILLGLMSFCGLLLTYGLNTWLGVIMQSYGYTFSSLYFILVLNLGALVGSLLGSRLADKSGPQRVIAVTFVLAAITLTLMTFQLPLPLLFIFILMAGAGTIGTQILIYGFQSNYYTTNARAAGVAFCASMGRFGGIFGPILGGWLAAIGLGGPTAFYVFAGVALLGAIVTVSVPHQRKLEEAEHKVEEIFAKQAHDPPPTATSIRD